MNTSNIMQRPWSKCNISPTEITGFNSENATNLSVHEQPETNNFKDISANTHSTCMCETVLSTLQAYAKETLARLSVIENAMLTSGSIQTKKEKSNLVQKIEDSSVFITANNLPIQDVTSLNTFESNLKKEEFRKLAVIFLNLMHAYNYSCTTIVARYSIYTCCPKTNLNHF